MKVYGSRICSGCRAFQALMAERGLDVEFIEITENIDNLRAFLKLRDTEKCFDAMREEGRVGIPVFVSDNGEVTHDEALALSWLGQPPAEEEAPACEGCK